MSIQEKKSGRGPAGDGVPAAVEPGPDQARSPRLSPKPPLPPQTRQGAGKGVHAAFEAAAAGIGLAPERARQRMVAQLRASGIHDEGVLNAMLQVPRHLFVEDGLASRAYEDVALPIGHGQTISKPSTVARMIEMIAAPIPMQARAQAKVLEIGTGCGYQAAVLAEVFGEVVSIERVRGLADMARNTLRPLRLGNLRMVFGDGRLGAPAAAPFDGILLAAAGLQIPDDLLLQMRVPSRLLAPIESAGRQSLHLVERVGVETWHLTILDSVRFVPLRSGTS
jgi:protein-L-isoaspartate(D-aspartate) O-methyltransferase